MRKNISLWLVLFLAVFAVSGAASFTLQAQPASQTDPTPTADAGHAGHHPAGALQGTVWVANEEGNSLSVIDAATNEVITTLEGIEGPHNIQASPDEKSIWAISGHDSVAVKIDPSTYSLVGSAATGSHPAHIIVLPDGESAYVTNSEDNSVTVIDTETVEVTATIPVGEYPHGMRPSPDGKWVYVANLNGNSVSVIDTETATTVADIPVGNNPVQVGFSPDGTFAYVSLNGDNALGKIDVESQTLVDTVEVGGGPVQVFVTPDNAFILVANQGTADNPSTTVSIIDAASFSVVATIETGQGAHGIVIDPSGQYAYVTNIYENTVSVLDITTQAVTATIPVGEAPNGITFISTAPSTPPSTSVTLGLPDHEETEGEEAEATAEASDDHNAHHPEETPDAQASSDDPMQEMMGMMDMMMEMEMSDEMRTHMEEMQAMMDSMSQGGDMMGMMDMMMGMMDMMMGMEMSDDMRTQMEEMHDMMDSMSGTEHDHSDENTEGGSSQTEEGHGHAMQAVSSEGVPAATEDTGGQMLAYEMVEGTKVFEITAQPVIWEIMPGVNVTAWTYNGTVPGPMIRVTQGDSVRLIVRNELPEATTVHWHGIDVPNAMDGVPGVTQESILPGESFTYEFVANPVGSFMYHSHLASDTQVSLGLYAPFIIDSAEPEANPPDVDVVMMLSEWRVVDGQTYPAMPISGMEPNFFTINGKSFPATEPITVQKGQRVRIRVMGIGQFIHPMHLHGMPFKVVATDGYPVPEAAQLTKDTINVAPGERYDIEFVATSTGTWVFHCHILHHTTNDGVDDGGLIVIFNVTE